MRCPVVQFRVRAAHFVEIDPASQTLANLAAGLEGVQVDALIFQGTPQPFDHDVVPPAPLAIHRNADLSVLEELGERIAGELAPLVGVEDLGLAEASQGVFERGNAEIGVHGVGKPP